jgi:hypothetical protein
MRVTERKLSEPDVELLRTIVMAAEVFYRAELLGFIMQDRTGVFLSLQHGSEVEVVKRLEELDWRNVVRMAEEYTE